MQPTDNRIDSRDWLLLGLLSILWGGSFFFNSAALRELPPFTLVLLRVGLGAAFLLPLLRLYQIKIPTDVASWRPYVVMALLNNVLPFSLIVTGQLYISSGLASILNATTPLFTVAVMAAVGEERLIARRVAGVIVGLVGVIILRGTGIELLTGQGIGILLCLAAALSYGFAALVARRWLSTSPPLATATCQLIASTVMMSVLAALFDQPWRLPMPGAATWLAVLGSAGLSTALAYIIFFQVLRRSGATNVTLVTLLLPVTAILLGYFVLGEPISVREIVGALVIASALLVIDGRVLKWFSRATPSSSQATP